MEGLDAFGIYFLGESYILPFSFYKFYLDEFADFRLRGDVGFYIIVAPSGQ